MSRQGAGGWLVEGIDEGDLPWPNPYRASNWSVIDHVEMFFHCRVCGALPGERCLTPQGRQYPLHSQRRRILDAARYRAAHPEYIPRHLHPEEP